MDGQAFPNRNIARIAAAVFAAILLWTAACYRATREPEPERTPPAVTGAQQTPVLASPGRERSLPAPSQESKSGEISIEQGKSLTGKAGPDGLPERYSADSTPPPSGERIPEAEGTVPVSGTEGSGTEGVPAASEPTTIVAVPPPAPPGKENTGKPHPGGEDRGAQQPVSREQPRPGNAVVARLSEDRVFSPDGPPWARSREELVYRVEFLGITMGYARFSFLGKVLLSGREAYHLRVRAWTSDLLSIIYPINDTIDYYLDTETIVPLRQEYQKSRKEDDVAIYDQQNGRIVYRYQKDGKIRKQVDVVPNVYDPVSVAYYFRSRDIRAEEKARHMYAGRKLYEISAKPMGFERIRTDRGEFDTIVVQPVLWRDGKLENKGDLRMWMTRDDRHIPVRVYAKFRKIRTWTLVGELLPDPQGG